MGFRRVALYVSGVRTLPTLCMPGIRTLPTLCVLGIRTLPTLCRARDYADPHEIRTLVTGIRTLVTYIG